MKAAVPMKVTAPGAPPTGTMGGRGPGLTLVIDTSGAACAAAVLDGGDERARRVVDLGRGHAERVVDLCGEALGEAGADWGDLSRIAVCVGPGSFTGVRAGVAAARGFALSLGIPAIGVTTLETIARPEDPAGGPPPPCLVALDARRGQVYAQAFGTDREPLDAPVVAEPEAVASALAPGLRDVVGSGAALVVEALASLGRPARIGEAAGEPIVEAQPDIGAVGRAALRRAPFPASPEASSPASPETPSQSAGELAWRAPEPLYLRQADAKPPPPPLAALDAPLDAPKAGA